ncbi:MAG: hypothetical protein JNM63_18710, partial [Spirochaetia bacterium]|nr:hypothetical protein [Spirochaetia bacterium]
MSREFSDLFLERYLAGDIKTAEKTEFEAKLAVDPELTERLRAIRDSNAEILSRYPANKMAEAISQKSKTVAPDALHPQKKRTVYLWLAPVLVLGIAVFFWFSPLHHRSSTSAASNLNGSDLESPSGIRFKGEDQLYVYRKKSSPEKLENGQIVRSGEVVQLAYFSAGNPRGAIFSIDGRGNVTQHFPEKTSALTELNLGKKTFLRESYELDDAPRFEV